MRVKIVDDLARKRLFDDIRDRFGSWKEARENLVLSKSTFEHYITGVATIPEELFEKFKTYVSQETLVTLSSKIELLPDNWGESKGGISAYKKNKRYFEEGRKKALLSLRKKSLIFPSFSFSLFPEICEMAGAFVGDGCFNLYKNKLYHVEFSGDKRYDLPYYQEIIIPAIKKIIPSIHPHFIESHRRENSIRVVFCSKDLFYLLKDYFGFTPGSKTFSTKIPDRIAQAGDEYMRSAIRGVFDTDGGVFLDKRSSYRQFYPRIVFQTVSKPLYEQLCGYLSKDFKMYTRFNEKRQIYIIEIYGIHQVKKWISLIGFSNKRHLNRLAPVA